MIEVDVKVEASDLRHYMFCHKYKRPIGIVELLIGIGCLVGGIFFYGRVKEDWQVYMIFLIVFGVYFLVISPIQTFTNSAKQYLGNPIYEDVFHYVFSEEGIQITQNDMEAFLPWGEVYRIVDNGRSIVIYISRLSANILPKRCFEDKVDELKEMCRNQLDEKRARI